MAAGAILRIPFFFLLPDPKGQALDALLGSLAVGGGLLIVVLLYEKLRKTDARRRQTSSCCASPVCIWAG